MKDAPKRTVSELAVHVGGKVTGDGGVSIHGGADLEDAHEGEIAFVEDEKLFPGASRSRASCLIVRAGASIDTACRIEVAKPKLAFAQIAEILHPPKQRAPEIHPSAIIGSNAVIGDCVFIGAFVCVGEDSEVVAGTQIRAGVKD